MRFFEGSGSSSFEGAGRELGAERRLRFFAVLE